LGNVELQSSINTKHETQRIVKKISKSCHRGKFRCRVLFTSAWKIQIFPKTTKQAQASRQVSEEESACLILFHTFAMIWTCTYLSYTDSKPQELLPKESKKNNTYHTPSLAYSKFLYVA